MVGLGGRVEILVNDANAAGLRHGDRKARFGDGVHGGRDDGDREFDPPVSLVRVETWPGNTEDAPGFISTSSKVRYSSIWRRIMANLLYTRCALLGIR